MDTQKFKSSSKSAEADSKSENAGKMKQAAGTAAQFVGAAGVGVAGAMAVQAMDAEENTDKPEVVPDKPEKEELVVEELEPFDPAEIMIEDVEEVIVDEDRPEGVLETFEESEEPGEQMAQVTQEEINEISIQEPLPITGIDPMGMDTSGDVAVVDVSELTEQLIGIDVDDTEYSAEADPGAEDILIDYWEEEQNEEQQGEDEPENWVDDSGTYLANNDASTSASPNILDDILGV